MVTVEEIKKEYKELEPSSGIRRVELWKFVQGLKNLTPDEFGGWLIGQEIHPKSKIIRAIDLWNNTVEDFVRGIYIIRDEIRKGEWKIREVV